ncbi:hypothetical protein [Haloferula sp.]|uniref:hypothetical protein n=1 Tax=Haloferula sp. TaxID=2497595 RepID=UPI003C7629B3
MPTLRFLLQLTVVLSTVSALKAGGVTVITHGFNSDVDGWILPMAQRFSGRSDFPGSDLTCYIIEIGGSDGAYTTTVNRVDGPPPDQSDTGEIVVKLDWSSISTAGATSSTDVAIPAAAALLSTTLIPENGGRPLAELPLHLLGHSRGSSVVSEIARLLGAEGVWVDHMTLWDPVDSTFGDATIGVWENVLFADNYYQQFGEFLIPQGRSVAGCFNRKLTNLSGGYGYFSGGNHSDVHAWYHGTVELGPDANDGNIDITNSMRSTWYASAESSGATGGFHYSRIAGGDRLSHARPGGSESGQVSDGYNRMWDLGGGVSANRNSLPTPVDPWPNLIIARRSTVGSLTGGETFPLEILYQSETSSVGDPTLSLFLDPDPNPWNGNEILLSSEILNGSGFNSILTTTPAPLLPAEIDGSFFLLARIHEDGRTRYLSLHEPLQITAAIPTPNIVPGSLRFESGLFTLTINGVPGQQVIVQAATTFSNWQSIATLTLEASVQDYSDPDSGDFDRRFYRIGLATTP